MAHRLGMIAGYLFCRRRPSALGFALAGSLALLATFASHGRAHALDGAPGKGDIQAGAGLGFYTSIGSESAFGLSFNGNYYVLRQLRVGPRLSFGIDSNYTLYTLMVDAQYIFDLHTGNAQLNKLKPFAGGGLGVNILDVDRFDAEAAFTFEFGGGADYYITPQIAVGTQMHFMFPIDLFDDAFIFQWQVVTGSYTF